MSRDYKNFLIYASKSVVIVSKYAAFPTSSLHVFTNAAGKRLLRPSKSGQPDKGNKRILLKTTKASSSSVFEIDNEHSWNACWQYVLTTSLIKYHLYLRV